MVRKVLLLSVGALAVACVNEQPAVVRTAAEAETPWTCAEQQTQVQEIAYGTYRLTGCGRSAIYECNFAFNPPFCAPPE
jgi:hypothetical protein